MAFAYFDRVKEFSISSGTGVLTLIGAVPGFRAFSAVYVNNDTFHYTIYQPLSGAWETGLGRWNAGNQFNRVSVLASSNANALVNFSILPKEIFVSLPAAVSSSESAPFFTVADIATRDAIPAPVLRTGMVVRILSPASYYEWSGAAWVSFSLGTGDLKADGTVPLTATWNINNRSIIGGKSYSYANEIDNTGASPVIDFATGDLQKLTLSTAHTPTFGAPLGKGWVQVSAIGDGTARTITWPGSVIGTPPAPTATAGVRTFYPFFYDGTNYHYIAGGSSVVAGNGLLDTAGTFSVKLADATLVVSAAGVKRAPITGDVLIADGSNVSTIATDAVTNTKILNNTIADTKLAVAYLKADGTRALSGTWGVGNFGLVQLRNLSYNGEVATTGATPNVFFSTGDLQRTALNANATPVFTPPPGVGRVQWHVQQDATGGRTITFPVLVLGVPPQPAQAANAHTIYEFFWDGTNYFWVPTAAPAGLEYDNGNSTAAATITFGNGTYQKITLNAASTFAFTPPSGPCTIQLKLIQDVVGSRVVTWPANLYWPGAGAPSLSTVAGDQDIISIYWDGTNYYGVTNKVAVSQLVPSATNGRVLVTVGGVATWTTTLGNFTDVLTLNGLEVTGKSATGVETTLVPRGDATTLARRFADLVFTDAVVTTAVTEVSIVEIDLSSVNFNGGPLVNGLLKVRFECEGVQTAGNLYSHGVEKVALVRRSGGTLTLVNTPVDGNTGTGGQFNTGANPPSVATIKVSGNLVQGRIAPFDASSATWFGKLSVQGFDL